MTELAYVSDKSLRSAAGRLIPAVLQLLAPHLEGAASVLELGASDGLVTFEVKRRLRDDARLVAAVDEADNTDGLHALVPRALTSKQRAGFFPRRDELGRLPYAQAVFDLVYLAPWCRPVDPKLLAVGLRLVKPGGHLVVVAPLGPSLGEVFQAAVASAPRSTDPGALSRLIATRRELDSRAAWEAQLRKAGALEVTSSEARVELEITGRDPLITRYLTPLLFGEGSAIAEAAPELLAGLRTPLRTQLVYGCIVGRRGALPASMS